MEGWDFTGVAVSGGELQEASQRMTEEVGHRISEYEIYMLTLLKKVPGFEIHPFVTLSVRSARILRKSECADDSEHIEY